MRMVSQSCMASLHLITIIQFWLNGKMTSRTIINQTIKWFLVQFWDDLLYAIAKSNDISSTSMELKPGTKVKVKKNSAIIVACGK